MVKEGLMKKLLVLSLVFACMTGNAQVSADSVVMTVAGKQIPLDEFIFIAQKNSEVNLSDRKSVNAYVELFKNFKLKVAEAEDLGLDKTKAFKDELDSYRAQLTSSYLSDKDGEEAAVRAVYDRYGEVLELSHILFRLPQRTLSKDTVPVYQKAIEAYSKQENEADPELRRDNRNGRGLCQQRRHDAAAGHWCDFRLQCGYHRHSVDSQPGRRARYRVAD